MRKISYHLSQLGLSAKIWPQIEYIVFYIVYEILPKPATVQQAC